MMTLFPGIKIPAASASVTIRRAIRSWVKREREVEVSSCSRSPPWPAVAPLFLVHCAVQCRYVLLTFTLPPGLKYSSFAIKLHLRL